MKPPRKRLSYHFFFLAINLTLSTAQGQTWWEKGRGGWKEPAQESLNAQPESSDKAESNLSDTEDSFESAPKANLSEFQQEVARRKAAAAKARDAVNKPTVEEDLQSLEQTSVKAESDELPVKKEVTAAPKKVKRVAKKRSSRELSSIESSEEGLNSGSSSARTRTKGKTQENIFRVGILSGIASITGTNGSTGGSLLNLALQADFQSKYWGIELDSYYGVGLGLSASGSSASSMSQSQYGLFLGPKFNYTFGQGSFKFTPKVGVGYAMFGTNVSASSTLSGISTSTSEKSTFSGIYAMGGFDLFLTRWLFLDADYATSVSASASAERAQNGVSTSLALKEPKFQRIRAGVNFLIGQHLILGAQYYSRNVMTQGVSAPQNFILGHLGYQF